MNDERVQGWRFERYAGLLVCAMSEGEIAQRDEPVVDTCLTVWAADLRGDIHKNCRVTAGVSRGGNGVINFRGMLVDTLLEGSWTDEYCVQLRRR